ncbi:four helix bundle protein [Echinicola soli]|uniref:Four helix bundle protein n=1 Tax=Echinicola soli TaxID=2591634 RepID=A0A514CIR0_9BACT|nr:four helix bundle protein [Echinicola soli]QDH79711.1 four helix bundle protein [Echinicola soli]
MAKNDCFEELDVRKYAAEIGIEVYDLVDKLPLSKDFKSRDQLSGAAISISNNIAEGFEYNDNKNFIRFLEYAKGSAGELRSQAFVLSKAGRIKEDDYWDLKESLLNI